MILVILIFDFRICLYDMLFLYLIEKYINLFRKIYLLIREDFFNLCGLGVSLDIFKFLRKIVLECFEKDEIDVI